MHVLKSLALSIALSLGFNLSLSLGLKEFLIFDMFPSFCSIYSLSSESAEYFCMEKPYRACSY